MPRRIVHLSEPGPRWTHLNYLVTIRRFLQANRHGLVLLCKSNRFLFKGKKRDNDPHGMPGLWNGRSVRRPCVQLCFDSRVCQPETAVGPQTSRRSDSRYE